MLSAPLSQLKVVTKDKVLWRNKETWDECAVDVVFDDAFGGVGDEEVVVREGLDEEALVEFMDEWCEEDEDDDRSG
ncbi:hypothetical protein Tco_1318257 [Tanacetum coccineum]